MCVYIPRPRTSVLAERFWAAENVTDKALATPRLHEFNCRVKARGISAGPIGSTGFDGTGPYHTSFCPTPFDFMYQPPPPVL